MSTLRAPIFAPASTVHSGPMDAPSPMCAAGETTAVGCTPGNGW
jgi:hypothetical protein